MRKTNREKGYWSHKVSPKFCSSTKDKQLHLPYAKKNAYQLCPYIIAGNRKQRHKAHLNGFNICFNCSTKCWVHLNRSLNMRDL